MIKKRLINILIFILSTFICLGFSEYVFRKIIFSPKAGKDLRDAGKYCNPLSQDYWALNYSFETTYMPPKNPHPLLGWIGFFNRDTYEHNDLPKVGGKRKVLMYGDSFVMCVDTVQCFEEILNSDSAFLKNNYLLNYGVGGYGVDQIYLLCSLTVKKFENPFVVFSIMPGDMDRSILKFRIGQKPFYEIENDELILKNIPINPSTEEYVKQNPVTFNSYLWQKFKYSNLNKFHNQQKEDEAYHQQIEELNGKIILQADKFLKDAGIQYIFMVFDNLWNSDGEWRSDFLRKFLSENKIPFFMAGDLVKADSAFGPYDYKNYMIPFNGHPNTYYNKLVAKKIRSYVSDFSGTIASNTFVGIVTDDKTSAAYWENQIRSNANWLNDVKKKAAERKIPLDSMIRMDVIWMTQNH